MPPQFQNNQTNVPENKPKRNYAFLLTLTFLLLLSGVFGVWYFSQVPPQDETEIVATKDQFADWKTYRNEEFGFEFEYPKSSYIEQSSGDYLRIQNYSDKETWNSSLSEGEYYLELQKTSNATEKDLRSCKDLMLNPKEIYINGLKGYISEGEVAESGGQPYEICALKDSKFISIVVTEAFNSKLNIANQILSTFKFIPSQSKVTSGIRGTVTIGPTCPVQKNPPDPNCADRPFQAGFNVIDQEGKTVKSFSSDENGKFSVDLDPGTYVIRNIPAPGTYPRTSPQDVTVSDGKYTELNLQFDSGIR